MSNLKLYPSGFLGPVDVPQTREPDAAAVAKQILSRATIRNESKYTASTEVALIWNALISGGPEIRSFDFNERILLSAISHLGKGYLTDWIQNQVSSPEYGDNHAAWIEETLSFVFGGQKRNYMINTWTPLLTCGNNPRTPSRCCGLTPSMKNWIFRGDICGTSCNYSMRDFIVMWVRQNGGVVDLATSLQVLYGVR